VQGDLTSCLVARERHARSSVVCQQRREAGFGPAYCALAHGQRDLLRDGGLGLTRCRHREQALDNPSSRSTVHNIDTFSFKDNLLKAMAAQLMLWFLSVP
jgi:hypothetical protein